MDQSIEIAILAGGRSQRMGADKTQLQLGGKTLLGRALESATSLELPVQVIQKDTVPPCGPLGGVITALRSMKGDTTLFLSVDMPFVPVMFLREFITRFDKKQNSQFTSIDSQPGFPFLLTQSCLTVAEKLHQEKIYALHRLADELGADFVKVSGEMVDDFLNINTPEDWEKAVAFSKRRG